MTLQTEWWVAPLLSFGGVCVSALVGWKATAIKQAKQTIQQAENTLKETIIIVKTARTAKILSKRVRRLEDSDRDNKIETRQMKETVTKMAITVEAIASNLNIMRGENNEAQRRGAR